MPDHKRSGSCLCGEISITTTGEIRSVINCHCKQCRRSHGIGAYTKMQTNQLQINDPNDNLKWYPSSDFVQRGFCQNCGSSLFYQILKTGFISVSSGIFNEPSHLKTTGHIFVKDQGDYYEITDQLKQYDGSMYKKS